MRHGDGVKNVLQAQIVEQGYVCGNDQVDVFIGGIEMKLFGVFRLFPSHARASDKLQLVKLQCCERKGGQNVGMV